MWEILKSWRKGETKRMEQYSDGGNFSPVHRNFSTSVNFKDLNICLGDDDDGEGDPNYFTPADSEANTAMPSPRHPTGKVKRSERNKLIIIMVGLPGRGKTFLCNKLVCYLNWLGHDTKLFNVGSYRRRQKDEKEVQDASFFDKDNLAGLEARWRALDTALDDLKAYIASDQGQVAIFDATNTTNERRQRLIDTFHGKFQYLFIESICTDETVLEQNYRYKMKYSPDYRGVDEEEALKDFKERIRKYEEVYEPLEDRSRHYIKLIDMVTGRGHMDINRISGYIPGKIVFFLMQVCKAGVAQERKIWLTRHGESMFNVFGKIGGNPGLSDMGREYSLGLPDVLMTRLPMSRMDESIPVSVWTSTLKRTIQTADYLVFPKLRWKALDEIHAGSCDGLTYQEIAERFPDEYEARQKDKLRYRYPAGESYLDVIQRLEPVIIELEREKECVCIVAHQAVLRAIHGYFTAAPLQVIPTLDIPLHTLIELTPRPDGTMGVEELCVMSDPGTGIHPSLPPPSHPEHKRSSTEHPASTSTTSSSRPSPLHPLAHASPFQAQAQASRHLPQSQSHTARPVGASVLPRLAGLRTKSPLRQPGPTSGPPAMDCIRESFNEPSSRAHSELAIWTGAAAAANASTLDGAAATSDYGVSQAASRDGSELLPPAVRSCSSVSAHNDGEVSMGLDVMRGSKLNVFLPTVDSRSAPTPVNSVATSETTSLSATPHESIGETA